MDIGFSEWKLEVEGNQSFVGIWLACGLGVRSLKATAFRLRLISLLNEYNSE